MYLIHLADIHIKVPSKQRDRDWYVARFNSFLDYFSKLKKKVQLIVISGDIFDKAPSADDMALFVKMINHFKQYCNHVIISEGNHDVQRDNHFLKRLSEYSGIIKVAEDKTYPEGTFGVPHKITIISNDYIRKGKKIPKERGILISHFAHELNIAGKTKKAEYPIEDLDSYDLVLLGDIHTSFYYSDKVYYAGSPYRTHKKTITKLEEIDNGFYGFNLVDLRTLTVTKMPLNLPNHYVWEQEGDYIEPPTDGNLYDVILKTDLQTAKEHVSKDIEVEIVENSVSFGSKEQFSASLKEWWGNKYNKETSDVLYEMLIDICPYVEGY